MRIGYMSSAAPEWDLPTLLREGRASGCTDLEPRVEWKHAHGLERGKAAAWSHARQKAADTGMAISAVALGTRLNRPTPEERRAAVDDIAAYAELAAAAGAAVLRIFGGPMAPGWSMEQARPFVAEGLAAAAERCAPFGVIPCLETHDAFWNPNDVAWCLEHAGHANVGATWHAAHHVHHDISVDTAYAVLAPWVKHVHA
ncbi:MAG TPA: TIM barrel protein, partial [Chloroflexota bacterium]|nr:TIM barrel protein [Chloroflexota bacterium]